MILQLNLRNNRKATIISAYAPTLLADQLDKEVFYSNLDALLSQVPRRNKIVLLGDFNAKLSARMEWERLTVTRRCY